MSAMWNRTLVYLGLREEPDEVYDGLPARFVPEDDPHAEHAPPRGAARRREVLVDRAPAEPALAVSGAGDGRGDTLTAAPASAAAGRRATWSAPTEPVEDNVRPLRVAEPGPDAAEHRAVARVAQVEITDFDDVEAVGARYRTGQAVLFDLSSTSSATARRVVDFVAGLTYALRGQLTKVGSRAFLLVPEGVRISPDERRRLTELGYRVPASGSTA